METNRYPAHFQDALLKRLTFYLVLSCRILNLIWFRFKVRKERRRCLWNRVSLNFSRVTRFFLPRPCYRFGTTCLPTIFIRIYFRWFDYSRFLSSIGINYSIPCIVRLRADIRLDLKRNRSSIMVNGQIVFIGPPAYLDLY